MSAPIRPRKYFRFPATLRWRLFLILFAGLAAAHALSFGFQFAERYISARSVMLGSLEKDVGTSIAILDRLPADERSQWLQMLARPNYAYELGPGQQGVPEIGSRGSVIAQTIRDGAGRRFPVVVESIPGTERHLQAHVTLTDNSTVTIDIRPEIKPLAGWLPLVLLAQLILLILCTWLAVRLAIRPLLRLANAAESLDPSVLATRLEETGPTEVAYAANAFNAMRDRIARHLEERVRILASISHDLQTPITRMKLRAELGDESPERDKLMSDLTEIERLVHEGVAYARSADGNVEKESRVDIGSLVESIAFDYQDTGKPVVCTGCADAVAMTRPHAIRRILTNLIDNALKFAGAAEIEIERSPGGAIRISVVDRGPGIPEQELEAVLQPFYRLEPSRSRETGGTGLGLAIAHQLAGAIGGTLDLKNRPEGGLSADLSVG
jgi:signal transduction histidine kinase